MHYEVDGFIVESELAAKPITQSNKYILQYISNIPWSSVVLDYGCGKMRFTIPLSKHVANVVAVDSYCQIYKVQTINGIQTSVAEYAKTRTDNVFVCEIENKAWKEGKYDRILLTNVLSAIPFYETRLNVLSNVKSVLAGDGEVLISTQYRNSYFKTYEVRSSCLKFYDGWLTRRSPTAYAFYGIVTPEKIAELCEKVGLAILDTVKIDGSVYVKASHRG